MTNSKKPTQKEIVLAATAYLWIIGFIISFFLNKDLKSKFVTHHIMHMFVLLFLALAAVLINAHVHVVIGEVLYFLSVGLWLYALIMVFFGRNVRIPYLTHRYDDWFVFLRN